MAKRRAEDPSYGQSKPDSPLETGNGNGEIGDSDFPELSFGMVALILLIIAVIVVFSAYAYFKFFREKKSEEEAVL